MAFTTYRTDKLAGMQIIYFICMLYHVLHHSYCWFTLDYSPFLVHIISVATFISFFMGYNNVQIKRSNQTFLWAVVLILLIHTCFEQHSVSLSGALTTFDIAVPFLFLLLKRNNILALINHFDKVLCPIIAISTLFWIFFLLNVPLVSIGTQEFQQYTFENYFFMIYNAEQYPDRFCGFTLEPGYFSLLLTCLLCFNRFKVEKTNVKIYLLAMFFTFSLGGYVLTSIAWYLSYTLSATEMKTRTIILRTASLVLVLGAAYLYVTIYWNSGENIVNEKIISRLEGDSEKGITGNNRYTEAGEIYFLSFAQTDDLWFGRGSEAYEKAVELLDGYDDQSIRRFIIRDGLIFTIAVIIFVFLFFKYQVPIRKMLPAYAIWIGDLMQHGVAFSAALIWMTLVIYSMETSADKIKYGAVR